jgi:hypothetical protein
MTLKFHLLANSVVMILQARTLFLAAEFNILMPYKLVAFPARELRRRSVI